MIDGLKYYFDKNGYRINDVSDRVQGPYYVEVDRKNGVMTVYNKAKTIPVKEYARIGWKSDHTYKNGQVYSSKKCEMAAFDGTLLGPVRDACKRWYLCSFCRMLSAEFLQSSGWGIPEAGKPGISRLYPLLCSGREVDL